MPGSCKRQISRVCVGFGCQRVVNRKFLKFQSIDFCLVTRWVDRYWQVVIYDDIFLVMCTHMQHSMCSACHPSSSASKFSLPSFAYTLPSHLRSCLQCCWLIHHSWQIDEYTVYLPPAGNRILYSSLELRRLFSSALGSQPPEIIASSYDLHKQPCIAWQSYSVVAEIASACRFLSVSVSGDGEDSLLWVLSNATASLSGYSVQASLSFGKPATHFR